MKFHICPHCGAHLDHGEACDCVKREEKEAGAPSRREEMLTAGTPITKRSYSSGSGY